MPQIFDGKSEQTGVDAHTQTELKLQMEDAVIETAPADPPAKPKGGSRKGRNVRTALLPENLPVEGIVISPLPVQADPALWRRIGEQVAERMERVPGRTVKQRLIRPTCVAHR